MIGRIATDRDVTLSLGWLGGRLRGRDGGRGEGMLLTAPLMDDYRILRVGEFEATASRFNAVAVSLHGLYRTDVRSHSCSDFGDARPTTTAPIAFHRLID